jgi:hypothetical protein
MHLNLAAAGPEAAFTAVGSGEIIDRYPPDPGNFLENQLSNSIASFDINCRSRIEIHQCD